MSQVETNTTFLHSPPEFVNKERPIPEFPDYHLEEGNKSVKMPSKEVFVL